MNLPLHLGGLHPVEQVLVYLLAFGPVLLLVGVVVVARKRDAAQEEDLQDGDDGGDRT